MPDLMRGTDDVEGAGKILLRKFALVEHKGDGIEGEEDKGVAGSEGGHGVEMPLLAEEVEKVREGDDGVDDAAEVDELASGERKTHEGSDTDGGVEEHADGQVGVAEGGPTVEGIPGWNGEEEDDA